MKVGGDEGVAEGDRGGSAGVVAEGGEEGHGGDHVREGGEAVCQGGDGEGIERGVGEEGGGEEANGCIVAVAVAEARDEAADLRELDVSEEGRGFEGRRRKGRDGGRGGDEDDGRPAVEKWRRRRQSSPHSEGLRLIYSDAHI